ncbi:hypothetical protein C8R46DRAFT_1225935 [Mycena filopes]|nr:hypothetical protein C8R46DRAFT_1225935 [Mycena filopes]
MSTTSLTNTSPFAVLFTNTEEHDLCVAFFGLSFLKNGRQDDELETGRQTVKRVKFAPACSRRVPHSSILQGRPTRGSARRIPVALVDHDEMDVEPAKPASLKRSAPDDDNMDVDVPPFKRVKTPFFLCDGRLVNNGPRATVKFTEYVVVVNPYDGYSDERKAGRDAWNARCTDGHLSEHAPAAVRAPVVVTITELRCKPYEELDEGAKGAWDAWNARCDSGGRSFFARGNKAIGKCRAFVDVTNARSHVVDGSRHKRQKKSRRRENAPYALPSRASRV